MREPLIELAKAIRDAGDDQEQVAVEIFKFQNEFHVQSRTEREEEQLKVLQWQKEAQRELTTMRALMNLPDLDADLATEKDC